MPMRRLFPVETRWWVFERLWPSRRNFLTPGNGFEAGNRRRRGWFCRSRRTSKQPISTGAQMNVQVGTPPGGQRNRSGRVGSVQNNAVASGMGYPWCSVRKITRPAELDQRFLRHAGAIFSLVDHTTNADHPISSLLTSHPGGPQGSA